MRWHYVEGGMQVKRYGALVLAFALGCGGDVTSDNHDNDAGGTSQGGPIHTQPSPCDTADSTCNDCVGCFETIQACTDGGATCGAECNAWFECALATEGCETLCCVSCDEAHPEGAAEAAAFSACLFEQACASTCAQQAPLLGCD